METPIARQNIAGLKKIIRVLNQENAVAFVKSDILNFRGALLLENFSLTNEIWMAGVSNIEAGMNSGNNCKVEKAFSETC